MSIGCQIEDKIPPPKISTRFHDDPTLLPRSIASHPFSSNFGVISLLARRCVHLSRSDWISRNRSRKDRERNSSDGFNYVRYGFDREKNIGHRISNPLFIKGGDMYMSFRWIDRIREKCMRHRSIRSKGIQGYKSGWKSVPCICIYALLSSRMWPRIHTHTHTHELPFCNKIQRRA